MNYSEIKRQLENPDIISQQSFILLKEIVRLFNNDNDNMCRDLVLRALEHRNAFGNYKSILDGLVRELGLFPYLDEASLSLMDTIAYEYHRPPGFEESIVFHREQAEVFRRLLDGENIILSAPTSFGKSKVIDAVIACRRYHNIVVIVPTIALIDETRRRLARYSAIYKIITQVSQMPDRNNIFVFTAERANVYERFPHIDFFVIDEFYKLGALAEDPKRTVALNHAFYTLSKGGAQFYLLGPCVSHIPQGLEQRFHCSFYKTSFATVASDEIRMSSSDNDLQKLCKLISSLKGEQTLIYCKSPKCTNLVAKTLLDAGVTSPSQGLDSAITWMERNFHADWILPKAMKRNIGIHHGRLPRSLAQYVVRSFNNEEINVLACTSTLIEGVNTKAKNIIIFDNTIAQKKFDFFTFNNIKGRSGRMFEHFVGRVFLFHDPPEEELPFVDFPVFTQTDDTPDSILVQLDDEDLSVGSLERLEPYKNQNDLSIDLLRKHSSIEPANLLELANYLKNISARDKIMLSWTGYPTWEGLKKVCELSWEFLIGNQRRGGVSSGAQLAVKISKLHQTPDVRRRILDELAPGRFAAETADEAVERVFEFERTWASFDMPRILRAFSDIRSQIIGGRGDYSFFASQLENLFRSPFQVALEEFGLPLQVSDKISKSIRGVTSIDETLSIIKRMTIQSLGLDPFEQELLLDCQEVI